MCSVFPSTGCSHHSLPTNLVRVLGFYLGNHWKRGKWDPMIIWDKQYEWYYIESLPAVTVQNAQHSLGVMEMNTDTISDPGVSNRILIFNL